MGLSDPPTLGCWPVSPGTGTVVCAQPHALNHCFVLSVRADLLDSIRGCAASRLLVRATRAWPTWFLLFCLHASFPGLLHHDCLRHPKAAPKLCSTECWSGYHQGKLAVVCLGWWDWDGFKLGHNPVVHTALELSCGPYSKDTLQQPPLSPGQYMSPPPSPPVPGPCMQHLCAWRGLLSAKPPFLCAKMQNILNHGPLSCFFSFPC